MTGTEWERELGKIHAPRLMHPDDVHEIEVAAILTTIAVNRVISRGEELIERMVNWDATK